MEVSFSDDEIKVLFMLVFPLLFFTALDDNLLLA